MFAYGLYFESEAENSQIKTIFKNTTTTKVTRDCIMIISKILLFTA